MITPRGILLGIDIGGTKLGLCVGTQDGSVLAQEIAPMDHSREPADILMSARARLLEMAGSVDACAVDAGIIAVGAACPGPLDYRAGCFLDPPNMPRWHGFAVRDALAQLFPAPARTAIMNDANATALAEWMWGAARGTSTAVYLTMSTGMGAGLIIDGRLYEGPLGLAGEIGRIRLSRDDAGPVGFGRRGSVEGYLSGPGMAQLAASEALACLQRGEATRLRDGWNPATHAMPSIGVQQLFDAARAGDAAALRVTQRIAVELGRLLALLTDILNPEVFVLGTIGSAAADVLIEPTLRALRDEALPHAAAIVRVVPSGLRHRGHQSALAVAARAVGHD